MSVIRKVFRSLACDEKGSALPIIAISTLTMVSATGVAVDMGRAHIVQSRLSSALDAAGLAAGATASTTDVSAVVTKFMSANFPPGYMGATLNPVGVTVSADNSVINLSASASVPTTFTKAFGKQSVTVSATSEITRGNKGLELVMVLDNTGSMEGTPLTDLKNAAKDLVNILFGPNNTTAENLWIGLVPFSQAVNIGNTRSNWLLPDSQNWRGISWGGCVDARELNERDVTDDPPSVALFPRYYWPDDGNNDWYSSSSGVRSGIGPNLGPNKGCPQPVTPMTSSKTTIVNAINSMQAAGNTHIVLGAAWGWRMLSPRWRTLWGGEMNNDNLPLDYKTPLMNKAAIIMTDGDNVISNSARGGYWYLNDGKLGTTNSSNADTQLNTRLGTVCTSMKANGITVYTIGFGNISTTAKTMLKNCASKPEFFWDTPDASELNQAFRAIGDALANLRISK